MMPHTVPNRPMYGRHRADRREAREVRLERVHLALVGGAHRAARAVERRRTDALPCSPVLGELAEAGVEDVLQCRRRCAPALARW